MKMKPSLALMCKSHNYWTQGYVKNGRREYDVRVGNWRIHEARRQELIGGTVVLTESQSSPAYLGGTIVGLYPTSDGRCEVIFTEDPEFVGNRDAVGHRGWGCGRGVCFI